MYVLNLNYKSKYFLIGVFSILISYTSISQVQCDQLLKDLEVELFPINTAEELNDTIKYIPSVKGLAEEDRFLIGRKNQPNAKNVRNIFRKIRQESCTSCLPMLRKLYFKFDALFQKEWTYMTLRGKASVVNDQHRLYRVFDHTFYLLELDSMYNNDEEIFHHLIAALRDTITDKKTVGYIVSTLQERAELYGTHIKTLLYSLAANDSIIINLIKPAGYSKQVGMDTVIVNLLPNYKGKRYYPRLLHALSQLQMEYGLQGWVSEFMRAEQEDKRALLAMLYYDLKYDWDQNKLVKMKAFQKVFIEAAKEHNRDDNLHSRFITIVSYFDSFLAVDYLTQILGESDSKKQAEYALDFMRQRTKNPNLKNAINAILK